MAKVSDRLSAVGRVIHWRWQGLGARLGQAGSQAVLTWLLTGSPLVPVWCVVTMTLCAVEALFFRRLARDPESPGLRRIAIAAWAFTATSFASLALILQAAQSPMALAAAGLLLCAINLNNAIMSRGWRAASIVAIAPTTLLILGTPLTAVLFGYAMDLRQAGLLEVGAIAYLAFIVRLVATLESESRELHGALEAVELAKEEMERAKTRWLKLFEESPLPQVCFDASRLYQTIAAHRAGGAKRLGDALGAHNITEIFSQLRLTEANAATQALFGGGRMDTSHFDASFIKGLRASLNRLGQDNVLPPFEAKILRADGAKLDVLVHVRQIDDGGPPWSTCITTYVDVTEARRAALAQREAVKAAEAANWAKSEFLANMSHEIRTPLNGVLGMAQVLERGRLSAAQRECLRVIRDSGAALLSLLNQILDLSKIEAGKLELEDRPFDLRDLAYDVHLAFRELAEAKGLALTTAVAKEAIGTYRGDPLRIRQVLSNLISNAIKFTPAGAVRIAIGPSAAGVRIVVADSGVGVPPDRIERLFDNFAQADSSTTREFGGTGLGLAICRELCHAMGGSIRAESKPGRGSRFTVELPLVRTCPARPAARKTRAKPAPKKGARGLRILAAEDNPMNRQVLRTVLEQAGLQVEFVENGQAAVAAWKRRRWDLILMDIQMPVMDGPTATREIRKLEAKAGRGRTPIIALTANAMTHQVQSYRQAGMDEIVPKPLELPRLFEAIATLTETAV